MGSHHRANPEQSGFGQLAKHRDYAQNAQSRDSDFNVLGPMDVTKVLSLPVLCIPVNINED